MRKLPILLDQDGVLADFVKGLYFELKQFTSAELFRLLPDPDRLTKFYIEECVDTGDDRHDKMLKDLIGDIVDNRRGLFARLLPMPGAVQSAIILKDRAKAEGIDVMVCTSPHVLNRSCHSDKSNWLWSIMGLEWSKSAIMTKDKTLVQGVVLVDDKPQVTGSAKPTWEHIIFDAPYNWNVPGLRVFGWSEHTVDFVLNRAVSLQGEKHACNKS